MPDDTPEIAAARAKARARVQDFRVLVARLRHRARYMRARIEAALPWLPPETHAQVANDMRSLVRSEISCDNLVAMADRTDRLNEERFTKVGLHRASVEPHLDAALAVVENHIRSVQKALHHLCGLDGAIWQLQLLKAGFLPAPASA